MAQKLQRKYTLDIQGVVEIDDGRIFVCVDDCGEFDLADLMRAFDGNECKISVSYNEETGEVI
jgi:hypothetical protein